MLLGTFFLTVVFDLTVAVQVGIVLACALFIRRSDYAAQGLGYVVEFSANLGTWQASADAPKVLTDNGSDQVVSVPYPALVAGQPARFFRVVVSAAP